MGRGMEKGNLSREAIIHQVATPYVAHNLGEF